MRMNEMKPRRKKNTKKKDWLLLRLLCVGCEILSRMVAALSNLRVTVDARVPITESGNLPLADVYFVISAWFHPAGCTCRQKMRSPIFVPLRCGCIGVITTLRSSSTRALTLPRVCLFCSEQANKRDSKRATMCDGRLRWWDSYTALPVAARGSPSETSYT